MLPDQGEIRTLVKAQIAYSSSENSSGLIAACFKMERLSSRQAPADGKVLLSSDLLQDS